MLRDRSNATRIVDGVRLFTFLVVAALTSGTAVAQQPQSPSFLLVQSTVNNGGSPTDSASFLHDASTGQDSTIGTSASPSFVVQSGFWSFVGSGLVPVVLMATKNQIDGEDVDLDWTGNNPPYEIYSISTDCSAVHSSFLSSEISNAFVDSPSAADLICYSVLATAPGPRPEPETLEQASFAGAD